MSKGQNGPKVVTVEGVKLDQFQPGDQLLLYLGNIPTSSALIVDPQRGQAIVRPAVTGQHGAGYRDVESTLGSRPFQEGSKAHVAETVDPEIKWGELVFGHELVLRNEDAVFGTDGRVLYTGQQLTAVVGPQGQPQPQ